MRRLDLLIAIVALFAGVGLTAVSYRKMIDIERPQVTALDEFLVAGTRNYKITSRDQCVGELQVDTDPQQNVILNVNGSIRTTFQQVLSEVKLSVRGLFNPLGQMADLVVNLGFGEAQIVVKTRGIHPISVQLTSTGLPSNINFSTTIDGPVLIHEFEPGAYRLEYSQSDAMPSPFIKNFGSFFNKSVAISVKPIDGPRDPCLHDQDSRLELDSLVQSLMGIMQTQRKLLNGFMPGQTK